MEAVQCCRLQLIVVNDTTVCLLVLGIGLLASFPLTHIIPFSSPLPLPV